MTTQHQLCTRCVLDAATPEIQFDDAGACSYCHAFERRLATIDAGNAHHLSRRLAALVAQVRNDGRGKAYDCIVGVSGGADSAYALYTAKKNGLRPLAVHMDNGWDSELAANNIENLVRKLGVDLHTHVIEWGEYRNLMQAFFDADVVDVELLYDNAMLAVNYEMAAKCGVRWILGGTNTATEGMPMPPRWNWFKYDKRNILSIARRSSVRVRTFPAIGTIRYAYLRGARRVRWVPFLDYVDYNKDECVKTLVSELGFRTYPYKHYESILTRFYQGYILPKKFNIDKRRLHLSTLVVSKQLPRDEALRLLAQSPYPSEADLQSDIEYFLKKMGWSRSQLDEYLARPAVGHDTYGSERALWNGLENLARRFGMVGEVAKAKATGAAER